jgi:8-oxo-dGTP diphosphatase
VKGWSTLSEEQAKDNPDAVRKLMRRLISETATTGVPRAICGHRPVLPLMLDALGVPSRPMLTAAVLVAHLTTDGRTVSVEWHKPRV